MNFKLFLKGYSIFFQTLTSISQTNLKKLKSYPKFSYNIKESMPNLLEENSRKSTHYKKITREQRLRLIQFIKYEGLTIKAAAKKLKLSASTARVIFRSYQADGTIFESKAAKKQRLEYENLNKEQHSPPIFQMVTVFSPALPPEPAYCFPVYNYCFQFPSF